MVVWDEVLEFGAPEGVTVMVWRERAAIAEAAAQGFDVIAAPSRYTYLDYGQYHTDDQPLTIGGPLLLEEVTGLADELRLPPGQSERLLGGQFQLWSEYVPTWGRAEYLMWPRGSALAQQLWAGHPGESGSLAGLSRHLQRLTAMELAWCRAPLSPVEA